MIWLSSARSSRAITTGWGRSKLFLRRQNSCLLSTRLQSPASLPFPVNPFLPYVNHSYLMPFRIKSLPDVVDWGMCVGCGACYSACDKDAVALVNIEAVGIRP